MAPLNKPELEEAAIASIEHRERDLMERMARISAAGHK